MVKIVRELLALRLIRHEYVAKLIDYFPQGYSLVLVCEYLPLDLYEYLRLNTKPMPIGHVKSCTKTKISPRVLV